MATCQFKMIQKYSPSKGDMLILPFLSAQKEAYAKSAPPQPIQKLAKTGSDSGSTMTIFAGKVGQADVLAQTSRLDADNSNPRFELKKVVAAAISTAEKQQRKRVVVFLRSSEDELAEAVQEGTLLGGYRFDRYLSKKAKLPSVQLVLDRVPSAALKRQMNQQASVLGCVNFARDVLNEPPNVITPPSLAREFAKQGSASGLKITVWDEKRLSREKCGGVLGVGQGASAKPRLVIGEYKPRNAKKHLALVGKGVTFDSGGYCLKPSESQIGMKYDMGGAAALFAAGCAIARLKLPIRLTVLTPLVENDISGDAYHTTSVLKIRSGRTVEVHNTDAEGRLILADALTIASERKPDWIIDAATLTGACMVALGEDIGGVYSTDDKLCRQFIDAGLTQDEFFWQMPLHMPYAEQLKTTIADCKNIGVRWGGSITAALFLKEFVAKGITWIHCDIAGPGGKEQPLGHLDKGAKGFAVKSVVALARELAAKK